MLLDLLKDAFPDGNTLPESYYETKKLISALGLEYEKIDACPSDCMLYWKDKANENACSECGLSRWKTTKEAANPNEQSTLGKRKKIPAKILRWFPLKPRLQRLFMSSKTASLMRWHDEGRTKDGLLRHPADSQAWKEFNCRYPDFSSDPRNVRLGLASDGFNPFRTMSVRHSTWPVILVPYNLPPWVCMKQPSFILSLLIPGPRGPGNKMDVYMQPLVDELKELWEVGIETFDASAKETFQMRAALMWTINDFPAYANLSGWSTKGQYACPCCGFETASKWLRYSRKYCYMCHRRWLDANHKFRYDSQSFDGTQEFSGPPTPPSGTTMLRQLEDPGFFFGDASEDGRAQPWKKKSVLFTLPYWKHQLLRHNLDVLHIEKNVCDNIVFTLLNQDKKTKDNCKARRDLEDMGIRSVLHPKQRTSGDTKFLPKACYQMTSREKDAFLKVLKEIRAPDEYSSNISRCVELKQRKILGLKSYDCHVLMQELLPIAIRGSLPERVSLVIIDVCRFFKEICSKVLDIPNLEQLESRIAITLCQMEKIFPPSFFTIMVHLIIHLASEVKVAGPVHYRWMYPIERYLLTLKSFVRNRAHPEGSIAEGYLAHECLSFCSRYLSGVETRFNRPIRNDDDMNSYLEEDPSLLNTRGRPLGKKKGRHGFKVKKRKRVPHSVLDKKALIQAHRYVLFNCEAVTPFREQHAAFIKRQTRSRRLSQYEIDKLQSEMFHEWFRDRVARLVEQRNEKVTDEIKWLARGPSEVVRRYTGYMVNGFRFHTKERERFLKTQNSGVVVTVNTVSYASARDRRPVQDEISYYGALTDIIQLDYSGRYKTVLFKCDWIDIQRGCKKDSFGYTLVNFSHLKHTGVDITDDPFVLASQAKKVFYIADERHKDWLVVVHAKVRDMYDMGDMLSIDREQGNAQELDNTLDIMHNDHDWIRRDDDDDEEVDIIPNMEDEHVEGNEIDDDSEEEFF